MLLQRQMRQNRTSWNIFYREQPYTLPSNSFQDSFVKAISSRMDLSHVCHGPHFHNRNPYRASKPMKLPEKPSTPLWGPSSQVFFFENLRYDHPCTTFSDYFLKLLSRFEVLETCWYQKIDLKMTSKEQWKRRWLFSFKTAESDNICFVKWTEQPSRVSIVLHCLIKCPINFSFKNYRN